MIDLEKILDEYESVEDLETDLDALNSSGSSCLALWDAVRTYVYTRREQKWRSGVFIKTACGEEHHIEPTQEVSTIHVNGVKVYENS